MQLCIPTGRSGSSWAARCSFAWRSYRCICGVSVAGPRAVSGEETRCKVRVNDYRPHEKPARMTRMFPTVCKRMHEHQLRKSKPYRSVANARTASDANSSAGLRQAVAVSFASAERAANSSSDRLRHRSWNFNRPPKRESVHSSLRLECARTVPGSTAFTALLARPAAPLYSPLLDCRGALHTTVSRLVVAR
jgi:hypothetical protein